MGALEDWALEYLTSLEMPEDIPDEIVAEWACEQAPVLAQHLREATEGFTANMDPPKVER